MSKVKGPNPIIESFVISRLDGAEQYADTDERVEKEHTKFIDRLFKIKELITPEDFDVLESAANGMAGESIRAGYRLGVVEGISFMQEIDTISGVVGENDE